MGSKGLGPSVIYRVNPDLLLSVLSHVHELEDFSPEHATFHQLSSSKAKSLLELTH